MEGEIEKQEGQRYTAGVTVATSFAFLSCLSRDAIVCRDVDLYPDLQMSSRLYEYVCRWIYPWRDTSLIG